MAKSKEAETLILDPATMNAETPADYLKRGWLYFSKNQYDLAAGDFRHALASEENNADGWYALGLALKGSGATSKAVEAFEHVLGLVGKLEDKQRANILTRLTHGQINQLKTGDWNLEKEVWKRVA
jgi:tetratricopeptide (TPR) repeat protein